jgi:hypothetical protein
MQLVEFTDISCFKEFCLDRLAVGVSPELIAQDVSIFVGREIGVEQILSSNSSEEILARRKALLEEIKQSAPIISREMMFAMSKVKSFMEKADEAFKHSDMGDSAMDNFDAYRRAVELWLKTIEVASKQINMLAESTAKTNVINITFNFEDLQRLENCGAVKIVDAQLCGDMLGTTKQIEP